MQWKLYHIWLISDANPEKGEINYMLVKDSFKLKQLISNELGAQRIETEL